MANKGIKGITVDIGGNTEPLANAIKGVNAESRDLQNELKQVEKLLKLDPTNTELLAQKQKLLADSIATSKGKLDTLKDAERQAQVQFAQGKIGEDNYRALQREVVKTEQSLKDLESEAIKSNAVLSKEDAVNNLKNMGRAAAAAGAAVGAALVGMAVAAVNNADELQTLSDVTGLSAERLQELKYAGNNLGVELETITGAQAKLTKSMAGATDATKGTGLAFKTLGISVRDGNGHLRDAKDVMAEAFTALNGVGNETERDALAMQIFGKSAMEMNPLIKAGGDELNRLAAEAKNNGSVMSNEAVAGLDLFGDTIDNLKASVLGSFGEKFAQMMPTIQVFLEKLMNLPEWIQKNSTLLTIIGVVIGAITALVIAFNIQQALMASGLTLLGAIEAGVTTVTAALGTALAFLTSPIGLVVLAIAALIAIGVLLYKNWDTIVNAAKTVWEGLSTFLSGLWTGIQNTATTAWTSFKTWITDHFNQIIQGAKDIWNGLIAWFIELPGKLQTIGSDMFTSMGNGVTRTIKGVKDTVVTGVTAATDWLEELPSQAYAWGTDFIQGLIDGIKDMVGSVVKAVSGVADKIKNFLHFSTPDEGPLADYETWMPDFMVGLADGIEANKYRVVNAIRDLSSDMNVGVDLNGSPNTGSSAGNVTSIRNDFRGMMDGAVLQIREDADLDKVTDGVARKIYLMQQGQLRAQGASE